MVYYTAVLRNVLEYTAVIPMLAKQNTLLMLCGYVGSVMHQWAVHSAETISSTKPEKTEYTERGRNKVNQTLLLN
jgi:hypothetical protein